MPTIATSASYQEEILQELRLFGKDIVYREKIRQRQHGNIKFG